jgi:hypothetical protein
LASQMCLIVCFFVCRRKLRISSKVRQSQTATVEDSQQDITPRVFCVLPTQWFARRCEPVAKHTLNKT